MVQLGLKLWSCNTDSYYEEAVRLFEEGFFDYIELYIVPNTVDQIKKWKDLKIPFVLHNAHFAHGFNLAKIENESINRYIYSQTAVYAEALDPKYLIFHGGIDGKINETTRQLRFFMDNRVLIENKPFKAIPNRMNGKFCRGSTIQELKFIVDQTNCGFCLDFGHAVCAANALSINPYQYIETLANQLNPKMYHLSDLEDVHSEYDSHFHFGDGELDIKFICENFIVNNAMVSIETVKNSPKSLDDFKRDVECIRKYI